MADIAEIQLEIKAVKFALMSFADDYENEERRNFLKLNFTAIPGLKTYLGFSETELKNALNKLQEKENLLLVREQQGRNFNLMFREKFYLFLDFCFI